MNNYEFCQIKRRVAVGIASAAPTLIIYRYIIKNGMKKMSVSQSLSPNLWVHKITTVL